MDPRTGRKHQVTEHLLVLKAGIVRTPVLPMLVDELDIQSAACSQQHHENAEAPTPGQHIAPATGISSASRQAISNQRKTSEKR